jgi:aminocarboxymuconate-semialdehyde decarboxylase
MVPMQDPDSAAAELAQIASRGLAGVEIASNILGKSIGDETFLPFLQEAERLGLSVFVHAMPAPMDRLPMAAMGGGDGHVCRGHRGGAGGGIPDSRRHRRRLP